MAACVARYPSSRDTCSVCVYDIIAQPESTPARSAGVTMRLRVRCMGSL
jgi:hypothetical protein